MKKKILIIKLGYSETLDTEMGETPSLGDVVRTTPILMALKEKYPESSITWLTSSESKSLLEGIDLIDRLLLWDSFVPFQLMREKFDILINLEKIPGLCALADMIDAWTKYGFRFESIEGTYHAYERGLNFIHYIEKKQGNCKTRDFWQKILIEMLDVEWKEQEYLIGYKPKTKVIHDIGLNYKVGHKWQTKAMPIERWKELERRLVNEGYSVSWQQGLEELHQYADWINSCRMIVSQDSLGIHLAVLYKKKVLGLFGPTDPDEIYFYGKCNIIHSEQECEQMACYSKDCITGLNCMEKVDIDKIVDSARRLLIKTHEDIN